MTTETSNARGEVVAWEARDPDDGTRWVTRHASERDGWMGLGRTIRPLIYGDAPPPAAARGDLRGLVANMRTMATLGIPLKPEQADRWADRIESALAAKGVQAGEVEQRVREFDLAVLDDAAETLDRLGDGSAGLRAARARIASALSHQPEARGAVDGWKPSSVEPPHNPKKDSLGTEYLIHPPTSGGDRTAFYGRRLGGAACWYRYGAPVHGVNFWQELPADPAALTEARNAGDDDVGNILRAVDWAIPTLNDASRRITHVCPNVAVEIEQVATALVTGITKSQPMQQGDGELPSPLNGDFDCPKAAAARSCPCGFCRALRTPSAPVGVEGLEALEAKWCESTGGKPASRRIPTFDTGRNARGEDDFDNEVAGIRRCASDLAAFIARQRALAQQPAAVDEAGCMHGCRCGGCSACKREHYEPTRHSTCDYCATQHQEPTT